MSKDKKDKKNEKVVHINSLKNKADDRKSTKEQILEIADKRDFEGFFRIVETLRVIGDDIEIHIDDEAIEIKVSQYPDEPIEVEGKKTLKTVRIGQNTINFDIPAYFKAYDDVQIDFDDYVSQCADSVTKMVNSLIVWE